MNLHLGCGPIKLPGFVNIDHSAHWSPDIIMDYLKLSDRFGEGVADAVFSCHSIEHLVFPNEAVRALAQVFRVLKSGGVVRIVVPDLMLVARKYVSGDSLQSIYGGTHFYGRDCPATRFLYFCREWSHTVVFDEPLLTEMMREAGFINVHSCGFGISENYLLSNIDRYPEESLSMEGTKP